MPEFKNLSPQTKSFVILFGVAIVGAYLTVMIAENRLAPRGSGGYRQINYQNPAGSVASASDRFMPNFQPVDTSSWKTYRDKTYPLTFQYGPLWSVKPGKAQNGFAVLEIDPGAKFYNIKIYISGNRFYGLDGLPVVQTEINGIQAYNISNMLYGIKMGPYYYTFDNGLSTNMIDNFNALVRSVKFE